MVIDTRRIEAGNGNPEGNHSTNLGRADLGGRETPFNGKTKVYTIKTFHSGRDRFMEMSEFAPLIDQATDLYLKVYPTRDTDMSVERMKHSLSHPRTILMLAEHKGVPVGFGIFPRLLIGGEPVPYSSRAFLPEHEGQGLGPHTLGTAIELHQEEVARSHRIIHYGFLMTQNAFSIDTLRKIPSIGEIFPFDMRYNIDRVAQYLLLGVHNQVYLASQGINTITGVSEGELSEIGMNEAYKPDRNHRAWKIHQEMVSSLLTGGLGMNRERGDVVYVGFRIKRPEDIVGY